MKKLKSKWIYTSKSANKLNGVGWISRSLFCVDVIAQSETVNQSAKLSAELKLTIEQCHFTKKVSTFQLHNTAICQK